LVSFDCLLPILPFSLFWFPSQFGILRTCYGNFKLPFIFFLNISWTLHVCGLPLSNVKTETHTDDAFSKRLVKERRSPLFRHLRVQCPCAAPINWHVLRLKAERSAWVSFFSDASFYWMPCWRNRNRIFLISIYLSYIVIKSYVIRIC
jgi:hypothetical protein